MLEQQYFDGRVRLICADWRHVALPAVDAVVCDPPYGIGFVHSGGGGGMSGFFLLDARVAAEKNMLSTRPIVGDDRDFDPSPLLGLAERIALFGADHFKHRLPPGEGCFIAWDKSLGIGPKDSFCDAEFAWVRGETVKRSVYRHLWKGLHRSKAGEDTGAAAARLHQSQKPVGLMRYVIEALRVKPDGLIFDPYMGSGSTGIAAVSLGYRFLGVEIDPENYPVACLRFEKAIASGYFGDS